MRRKLIKKIALAASLGLAMTFPLSCSTELADNNRSVELGDPKSAEIVGSDSQPGPALPAIGLVDPVPEPVNKPDGITGGGQAAELTPEQIAEIIAAKEAAMKEAGGGQAAELTPEQIAEIIAAKEAEMAAMKEAEQAN
jgi:hypothetical protein